MTISHRPEGPRRPVIASLLSFVFPGLGQLYLGLRRPALLFAAPVLVLLALVLWQLRDGITAFGAQMIAPTFALATLVVIVALAAWRLLAIGHAAGLGTRPVRQLRPIRQHRALVAVLVACLLGVGIVHGVAGYYAWLFYDAGSQIFTGDATPSPSPDGSANPSGSNGGLFGTPEATLTPPTNRVTFLLTGVDSGHNRDHALTDTLLVVSVNRDTNQAVMLSIPRDTSRFPMYSGGTYDGKINSLMTAAFINPQFYPDGPTATLTKEIGYLIGIPVNYYAAINLEGFQTMVDLVGGVDIVNPRWILDPVYDWFNGTYGFTLSPGPHHLNGQLALAYARSRYGAGDNDFTRAARQQQLLVALRAKMSTSVMLAKLPAILQVAATNIRTNFPPDQIRDYLILAKDVSDQNIQRFVLGPPYSIHPPTNTTGGSYILELQFDKVSALSIQLFGSDSRYWTPSSSPSSSPLPSATP